MLAGNNFPEIFAYLMTYLQGKHLNDKILSLINKQNSTGQTPLRITYNLSKDYTVITDSKDMLVKLLEHGADTSLRNEFDRTALD